MVYVMGCAAICQLSIRELQLQGRLDVNADKLYFPQNRRTRERVVCHLRRSVANQSPEFSQSVSHWLTTD